MTPQLDETVREMLASGRLGALVFVRWIARLPGPQLRSALAQMLALAQSWLNAEPQRLYAQEARHSRDLTVTALFVGGQTALLTAIAAAEGEAAHADLTLLGNRGAAYQEAFPLAEALPTAAHPEPSWLHAIERALQSREPVEWGDSPT